MIHASISAARPSVEPKQRKTANGIDVTTDFLLADVDVQDGERMTVLFGMLAFGGAALDLARIEKGNNVTVAGEVRGSLYQIDGLRTPKAVAQATVGYPTDSDLIVAFITECSILSDHATETSGDLCVEYTVWRQESGESAQSKRGFSLRIQERGI